MKLFKSHKIVAAMLVGSVAGSIVYDKRNSADPVDLAGKNKQGGLLSQINVMLGGGEGAVLVGYFNTPEAMEANEPDYYSVSPQSVFESGYTAQPDDHIGRMQVEKAELLEKTDKLSAFIKAGTFASLSEIERDDLKRQEHHMVEYLNVLSQRLDKSLAIS